MVNKFSSLGLCISFNYVDKIQSAITQNVSQQYRLKGKVCPNSLVENLFTTTAIDIIDHNETSTTHHLVIFMERASECFNITII